MADSEDLGCHFLDSMLEVEMIEEDKELEISKNDEPARVFPPIPTFDLQSETLSYKEYHKNPQPQSVFTTFPVQTPTARGVPFLIKPNSMLIYRRKVQPVKATSVLAPVKKITKPHAKPIASKKVSVNSTSAPPPPPQPPPLPPPPPSPSPPSPTPPPIIIPKDRFCNEVFKPEFMKNVSVKSDSPSDLNEISEAEMNFYKICFKDVTRVQNCRLHCTICDKHLGCSTTAENKISVHSMLKVLTCKACFEFYGDGNFPCDKKDNCEIYCRWCGQGGALVCCSFCPRVFCKKCVRQNYGPTFLRKVEKASDWACFCCSQKPLWPHRAICRALLEFIAQKKTDRNAVLGDTSSCCRMAGLSRKKVSETAEKNKIVKVMGAEPKSETQQVQKQRVKVPAPNSSSSIVKNKTFCPVKTKNEQLGLKPVVRLKPTDRVDIPLRAQPNSNSTGLTNIFSPKSIIQGDKIIRGISRTPTKFFSSFSSPQLIQTPVLHGETLITPPTRLLLHSDPPAPAQITPAQSEESPYVKVTLTHQVPEWDLKKVPTVKIPQGVQGLVLRLVFPDNGIQYIRLASEEKTSREFPMPQFKESGETFIEENLAEAFETTKMLYDKLMRVRDKVNSRTKLTEESIFNSSVKKLHLVYEQSIQCLKELDGALIESHEEWKKGAKNIVDVIDISDDETSVGKKKENEKTTLDPEVEIVEDVIVNGTTPNNFKESSKLKKFSEHKMEPARKRKKGSARHWKKKPKMKRLQNGKPEKDPLKSEPLDIDDFFTMDTL